MMMERILNMFYKQATAALLSAAALLALSLPALAHNLEGRVPASPMGPYALITNAPVSALTAQRAQELAAQYVPSGCTFEGVEDKDSQFVCQFYEAEKKETYRVGIDKQTQALASFDSRLNGRTGGKQIAITEAAAKKTVTDILPDAQITAVQIEHLGDYQAYRVDFQSGSCYGTTLVHPTTGEVLQRDIQFGQLTAENDFNRRISYTQLYTLAMRQAPDSKVLEMDLDKAGDSLQYTVELLLNGTDRVMTFDAVSGRLVNDGSAAKLRLEPEKNDEYDKNDYIGTQKARQIALSRVSGGKVTKCKLKEDDDYKRPYYEITATRGRYRYTGRIDAFTGAFWDWNEEFVGED